VAHRFVFVLFHFLHKCLGSFPLPTSPSIPITIQVTREGKRDVTGTRRREREGGRVGGARGARVPDSDFVDAGVLGDEGVVRMRGEPGSLK